MENTIDEAKKLIQQTCQPKWKISDETVIKAMETKDPPQDKNFKVASKYIAVGISSEFVVISLAFCCIVFYSLHPRNDWRDEKE